MVVTETWWSSENEMVEWGRTLDSQLTEFCDTGIELLEAIDRRAPKSDAELVRAIALTQLRNTLVVCWECAFAGYVAQSLALLRTATDFLGVAWHAEGEPAGIEAWLAFGEDAPITAGGLLQRLLVDPQIGPTFRLLREQLRPFVHGDTRALGSVLTVAASGGPDVLVDIGPVLNEKRFRATAFYLITVMGLAVIRAMGWIGGANDQWQSRAEDYLNRVGDWLIVVEP